jgi:GTP-binding protein
VLLCDPRLGLTDLDEILLDVIRPRVEQGLKFLLVLTKADKLTRAEATKALSIAKLQAGGGQAMLFSATKRQGFDNVAGLLWQWAHPSDGGIAAPAATDVATAADADTDPGAADADPHGKDDAA